ncbi:MAG: hypothetical protein QXH44_09760 [Pyrobaculum sp.]
MDYVAIVAFLLILELIVLITVFKKGKERSPVNFSRRRCYSGLNFVTLITLNSVFAFFTILIKHYILMLSYSTSFGYINLEFPLLILITFFVLQLIVLIKLDFHTNMVLLTLLIFTTTYLLTFDIFSYNILTDRIITGIIMVKQGRYPGFLDDAYNPIPFDVVLYSFMSLVLGVEPSERIVTLIYPNITLPVLFIMTWSLMSRIHTDEDKSILIVKTSFITVSLSQITCALISISTHESLWTAWVLVALFIYLILREYGKITVLSSTLASLLLIIASIFYHITAMFVLLALIIISIHFFKKPIMNKNMIIYPTVVAAIFSLVKSIFQTGYTVKTFVSLIEQILSLQLREELDIYVRGRLYESGNIFVRYAQSSPLLILSLMLVSLLYYVVKITSTKQNIKTNDEFKAFVGLSLSVTGFLFLSLSIVSLFVKGVYSTTFVRPALALLLLGIFPYVVVRSRIICNHKYLFIAIMTVHVLMSGLSINDPNITPRKGLYSPFVYVHSFDLMNLQFLQSISNELKTVVGSPEVSMYGMYLVYVMQENRIDVIGSTKNIRDIYSKILTLQSVPDHLKRSLIVSMNSIELQNIVTILNSKYSRVYDSGFYIAHTT